MHAQRDCSERGAERSAPNERQSGQNGQNKQPPAAHADSDPIDLGRLVRNDGISIPPASGVDGLRTWL